MSGSPDFGPEMLRWCLAAREALLPCDHGEEPSRKCIRKFRSTLRKSAKISSWDMHAARAGRLKNASKRLRLWGALGYVPADSGIRLKDDGGQEAIS